MDASLPVTIYTCPHCQMGNLHYQRLVFARWLGGYFLTIPNFPAWVCDVCGEREYEAEALDYLRLILGPNADLRQAAGRRMLLGQPEAPRAPGSNRRRV